MYNNKKIKKQYFHLVTTKKHKHFKRLETVKVFCVEGGSTYLFNELIRPAAFNASSPTLLLHTTLNSRLIIEVNVTLLFHRTQICLSHTSYSCTR